jgi:hypothetical protein
VACPLHKLCCFFLAIMESEFGVAVCTNKYAVRVRRLEHLVLGTSLKLCIVTQLFKDYYQQLTREVLFLNGITLLQKYRSIRKRNE